MVIATYVLCMGVLGHFWAHMAGLQRDKSLLSFVHPLRVILREEETEEFGEAG